ncbi:DUF5655 domain-containing protein [Mucilaginibacter ginkgonis]|uniref:DUF5655 domain-containing protein n=1 Tax=Mucilaginibacter ginkgonis TaxID=2682091 RepID=A0A6I4I0R8_9SPHI|nr:DUF5655 domain-containing protein [Mucilaginibacter ginkgonis]QQL51156.1 hypothetical protein GO620_006830 [Mucilaginibacter ginkgonis]
MAQKHHATVYHVDDFLREKSDITVNLYNAFTNAFKSVSPAIEIIPAKTMIGIATSRKRVAWITQFGKNFLHVVFPFEQPHENNLCFQKISKVPDDNKQYNHHLRIYSIDDINDEVIAFMKLAIEKGS